MVLHLTEPPSMEDVRRNRKMSEYYEKVIKGRSAVTLEDVEILKDVLNFGISLTL